MRSLLEPLSQVVKVEPEKKTVYITGYVTLEEFQVALFQDVTSRFLNSMQDHKLVCVDQLKVLPLTLSQHLVRKGAALQKRVIMPVDWWVDGLEFITNGSPNVNKFMDQDKKLRSHLIIELDR